MLYRISLKVICGMRCESRHFCSIPDTIYKEFMDCINGDSLDVNAYLSMWARQDWGVTIRMTVDEDIDELKSLIKRSSKKAYSELYVFEPYDLIPDEDFWVKLWVSSHMKDETERRKL